MEILIDGVQYIKKDTQQNQPHGFLVQYLAAAVKEELQQEITQHKQHILDNKQKNLTINTIETEGCLRGLLMAAESYTLTKEYIEDLINSDKE